MKICVLQPDYSTTTVDYQHYDPPRDLSGLISGAVVDHVFINKLTIFSQLKALSQKGYDVFVNLCEGYLEWEVPSIDLIWFLEHLNLPFTGPSSLLYDPTKELMKYVAYVAGVSTPKFIITTNNKLNESASHHLQYPLFVKPAKAGDSLGVDDASLVYNSEQLKAKTQEVVATFGEALVEEYIEGREFTVLLLRDGSNVKNTIAYQPIEYVFPEGFSFKTYALKTKELHADANVPVTDSQLSSKLKDAAVKIFDGFSGVGYARLDFRMNKNGQIFFLEINFTCSVFYADGYEGSADYILKHAGVNKGEFLQQIIKDGIARHQSKQKKFEMRGDAVSGYGIYAKQSIEAAEVVFKGEEMCQRIVTLPFIEKNWNEAELDNFKRYAYPISEGVYILWDNNPAEWAPQNHSCNANTAYVGLNVVAQRKIALGEELTLDYAAFLDDTMEPFRCTCNASCCRGMIKGRKNNSVTLRLRK
jgi:D-alanine-D-alanine ligase-like ATP-grasp enzyme